MHLRWLSKWKCYMITIYKMAAILVFPKIILFYFIALDKKESIQHASKMAVKVEMLYDHHL